MLLHCLMLALRGLTRSKTLSVIKITGLVIGISACLVVFLIANYELSFDRFQSDRQRIYRIYTEAIGPNAGFYSGAPTAWHSHIKSQFSGVVSVCNFHTFSAVVKVPQEAGVSDFGTCDRIVITPPDYFDVFNFYEWVIGSPNSALGSPLSVVLTESRARQYFGTSNLSDVIGREIRYDDSLIVTVSGIVKDVRQKTDFDFTDFVSFSTVESSWLKDRITTDSWQSVNSSSQLFIKVSERISAMQIEQQIPTLAQIFNRTYKNQWTLMPRVQSLPDLHFNPTIGIFNHSRSVPERSVLYTLIIVALLLLSIGVVNYINIETSLATDRAKEVGVRKTLGSSRIELVLQFLIQSLMFAGCAVIVSPIVAWIVLENFGDFVPPGVKVDFTDPSLFAFLSCCLIFVTLLAGLYPAFILTSYQPGHAIRNLSNYTGKAGTAYIRKGLSVFQFTFSQLLIIVTIAVGVQLDYILNRDLGFAHDAIFYFNTPPGESRAKTIFLRDELNKLSGIKAVSLSTPPTSVNLSGSIVFDNGKEMKIHNVLHLGADTAYLRLYEIELIAGRNFSGSDSTHEYLINETYLHTLGYANPHDILGKTLDRQYTIVGVVKDFHIRSLHSAIEPLVIYNARSNWVNIRPSDVKNSEGDIQKLLQRIESSWTTVFPDKKIEYKFLDDAIKRFYEVELRTNRLMKLCTCVVILISCLGLFSLSMFTVIQRKKEICIRKVSGASVNSIVVLLSTVLLKHVIIAFIIAVPIAYYFIHEWLLNFAYRKELAGWIFVIGGLATLFTAFFTVSYLTIKAAKSNPVKFLRHE